MSVQPPDLLDGRRSEVLVRLIEAGIDVHTKHQFFVWTQSFLSQLVPHRVMVCGSYQRPQLNLAFEAVHGVPVEGPILGTLTDGTSTLMQQLINAWLIRPDKALCQTLQALQNEASAEQRNQLLDSGLRSALVHGVTRPHRPREMETLFVLWSAHEHGDTLSQRCLGLVLPYLHSTYQRVVQTERRLAARAAPAGTLGEQVENALITGREKQILNWVREGKSNPEIGKLLSISPYTVKNHVQRILRKLDATNRTQAVAKAMMLSLLKAPAEGRSSEDAMPVVRGRWN